jgi:hypothetical protein
MTGTDKKNKLPVQTQRIVNGINLMFAGIGEILSAMEPDMAKAVQALANTTAASPGDPNDYEEILGVDDLPEKTADNTPATAPESEQEQTALTADDLIRVVTQKIKQSRANKEKVLALLKSYGAVKVSDIPQDQYEAFLTDVSQL